jgi:phospholipid/cholesterol/gamma-HCH transport system permease protein
MTAPEASMEPCEVAFEPTDGDTLRVRLRGRLSAASLPRAWRATTRRLERRRPRRAVVDAGGVTYCDAVGAAFLVHMHELQTAHQGTLEVEGFPEDFQPILDLLLRRRPGGGAAGAPAEPAAAGARALVERIGRRTVELARDGFALLAWIGEVVLALGRSALRPAAVRWRDALWAAQTAGVNSLPVVALIAFLLGLVMGFQSALQLHRFGADIYLANLIGLSMVRELGPLMTAIVLTARSGSAFAAEIGTMRINEEVDALTTMGVDPVRFLVAPRVIAAVVMTPILTLFANLAGLVGGAVVWVFTLDLPIPMYTAQLEQSIALKDLLGGLAKSFVFGVLVAGIGCIRGMQTRGGPSAVGQSTTDAVVSGIVLLAVADSVFSILFYVLGL